ncbi:hypothetical protein OV320_1283 [Actinobacteria bacterium OV320]|nr:hypothetical protein OV320_1283 [Actinobacteria bacterium OV320]
MACPAAPPSPNEPGAQQQKAALETAGCTGVEIVTVKPGELPEPRR